MVADKGKGTLWIATTGQPLPLQLITQGDQAGVISFTEWGTASAASPPPVADTIDIAQLKLRRAAAPQPTPSARPNR